MKIEPAHARTESRLVRPGSASVAAGVAFFLCWSTLVGLDVVFREHQVHTDLSGVNPLLVCFAGAAATLLGTLIMVQCRVAQSRRRDFGTGLGIALYGTVVLFGGELYPLGRHTTPVLLGCLPPATLLLVFCLTARGTLGATDPRTAPGRLGSLVRAALGIAVVAAMIAALEL